MTRLETFLRTNQLKPARVAREADLSRQQLLRIRMGQQATKVTTAVRIKDACSRLLHRQVALAEVLEIE